MDEMDDAMTEEAGMNELNRTEGRRTDRTVVVRILGGTVYFAVINHIISYVAFTV